MREQHHFHSCIKCGNIWDHDPPGPEVSRAEFKRMHTCNLCHSSQHCDIAARDETEAEEFATHEYITEGGKRFYAPDPNLDGFMRFLQAISDE